MNHFFATKFYHYFSGNPQSVGLWSIFAGSKTLQKVMKITHFDTLRGPSVHLEQASRRVHKIMQNYAKMHLKSPQNEHEKTCAPVLQWQKRHLNAWRAGTRQNAVAFAVPAFALLPKSVAKSRKITEKMIEIRSQKWTPRVSQSQNWHLLHRGGKMNIRSASGHVQVTLWTGSDNIREFSNVKIAHPHSRPPFALVKCLRSCPPRGGPIRSVLK